MFKRELLLSSTSERPDPKGSGKPPFLFGTREQLTRDLKLEVYIFGCQVTSLKSKPLTQKGSVVSYSSNQESSIV